MINVTLTFSGVPELLKFFESIEAPATEIKVEGAPAAPKAKKATPAATPVADAPSKPTVEAVVATAAPEKTAAESSPTAASAETAVDYATLQKAVFALAGKSRDAAAAVAASLGVKTFKELPESQWADALAAVNEALAA